jgi:hypothetical protein
MKRAERQENIRMVIEELSAKLDEQHIHYDIDGRPKHFYSIYRKMVLQNKPFDQIYDLIAIRVLVDTIRTATPCWVSCIRCGIRSPAGSRTTFPYQGEHVPVPAHHRGGRAQDALPL